MNIELYLIGESEEDAEQYFPYTDFEEAQAAAEGMGMNVYSVGATIRFDSIEQVNIHGETG